MEEKSSILRDFLPEIIDERNNFIHTELETLKEKVLTFLETAKGHIREHDRRKMVLTANSIQSLPNLQQYVFNSLLIFEGQGTVGLLKR